MPPLKKYCRISYQKIRNNSCKYVKFYTKTPTTCEYIKAIVI